MPELRSLLEDAAGPPAPLPDVERLVRRGRRRRRLNLAAAGVGGMALVLVAAGAVQVVSVPQRTQLSGGRGGAGSWASVSDAPLEPALGARAVDVGDGSVLVVGGRVVGRDGSDVASSQAALYDLDSQQWTRLPALPLSLSDPATSVIEALPAGEGRVVVWAETEPATSPFTAVIFDSRRSEWIATSAAPLRPRQRPVVEWVGDRLVVWGGSSPAPLPGEGEGDAAGVGFAHEGGRLARPAPGGAVWIPRVGWRAMPNTPMAARIDTTSAVIGDRLFIWGGADGGIDVPNRRLFADGAAFNPVTFTWQPVSPTDLSPRSGAAAIADGDGLIVAGGTGEVTATVTRDNGATSSYSYDYLVDGARWDAIDNLWAPLPAPPDGTQVVEDANGAAHAQGEVVSAYYDPASGTWRPGDSVDGFRVRLGGGLVGIVDPGMAASVWLGGEILYSDGTGDALSEADTPARTGAAVTAVSGNAVFVWGGTSAAVDGSELRHHRDGAVWRP